MMLKFTNMNNQRAGDPIYISKEWIIAVYEDYEKNGSLKTVIFGGANSNEWHVEESLGEVIKIINEGK